MANQSSLKPTRKVAAAGVGLPVALILVWILQVNGVKVPPEISAAIGSIISFALAYMIRDKSSPMPEAPTVGKPKP